MILLEALWKILRICPVCGANAIKGKPCLVCGAVEACTEMKQNVK